LTSWCSARRGAASRRDADRERQQPELPKDSADRALARLDRLRNANGGTPTAELRLRMQKVMQNNCAVFRTGEVLQEGTSSSTRRSMEPRTSPSPTAR